MAIDGPASSGKSTTAVEVSKRLGLPYLDTGAMFRAVTCAVKKHSVDHRNHEAVAKLESKVKFTFLAGKATMRVWQDYDEITSMLRTDEITKLVTPVCQISEVRSWLLQMQRDWALRGFGIMEGRDIGTVVLPDARLKIYMTAEPGIRAMRRAKQKDFADDAERVKELGNQIAERDRQDSERENAPLKAADDAVVIDTSEITFDEQVDKIIGLASDIFMFPSYSTK